MKGKPWRDDHRRVCNLCIAWMTDCLRHESSGPRHRRLLEGIAGTAHGAYRIGIGAADQCLAQSSHVHVDRAPVDEHIASPHSIEQLLARQHPTRVLHEEGEQPELGGPQANLALAARDAVRGAVEDDVSGPQDLGDARRSSAFTRASTSGTENGFTT